MNLYDHIAEHDSQAEAMRRAAVEFRKTTASLGWGKEMWFAHKALRVAASLALVAIVTAFLWRIQMIMGGSHQFIYFYLFPVIWIRMLYSDTLAAFSAIVASVLANYFLQYPLYSLYIDNPLEYGDHVCFVVLALLAIKCVFSEPLMPPRKKKPNGTITVDHDPSEK